VPIRLFILTTFFAILFLALGANLYHLQILHGASYIAKVETREDLREELQLRRGRIFFTDRNHARIPVALQRDYPVLYASPRDVDDAAAASEALAPILGVAKSKLRDSLSDSEKRFLLLADRASEDMVKKIESLGLKGVSVGTKQYRYYPLGTIGAALVGFVGINERHATPVGLYGLERQHEDTLALGEDLATTIDRDIQAAAEQTLEDLVEKHHAKGGTVIVSEPTTGVIRAMANYPGFDPNAYREAPVSHYINPAVQFLYEPGSVVKAITMAAGIDAGAVTPDTEYTDTGSVTLDGKTIKNFQEKIYHRITMTNVLEHSVNTGAVFVEKTLGHEAFRRYLAQFGFGATTAIGLPGEVSGSVKTLDRKEVRAIDFATASYGQGISATPIELVAAYGALANGGLLMRPTVLADEKPEVVRRAIAPQTSATVTDMLVKTVRTNGVATIAGYRIAGKTGTAFIPEGGRYIDEFIHTFIGYAPASEPKFLVLVKLDRPSVGVSAGVTVVPAFRELAQFLLNHYRVPPDDLEQEMRHGALVP
jgi:cell division protein FtsI/penicillin-binding protein 2